MMDHLKGFKHDVETTSPSGVTYSMLSAPSNAITYSGSNLVSLTSK